jgi:8-oxo-dGTP diphosphatase
MTKEYKNPALTTDVIVFSCEACEAEKDKDLKVLLIKRRNAPFKDKWAIPGGFIEYDEELEDAAARELQEETNISGAELEQIGVFGRVGRDPRGRTVSIVYYTIIDSSKHYIKAQDDAKEVRWFSVKNLPDLAFDHAEIMDYALKKFKKSFDNTQNNQ